MAINEDEVVDDLSRIDLPAIPTEDVEGLKGLWKFKIHREQAQAWTLRRMRFLVYDDTVPPDVEDQSDASEDEDAMLARAIQMSLETSQEPSCSVCGGIPEFPRDRKVRNFKLIKFNDYDNLEEAQKIRACMHYLAISYRWPGPAPSTAKVRDIDAQEPRPARASDHVLDRAVDCAISLGLRMIWIDQECLPQQNNEYQQMGLQAMDMVYHRAIATAGLLDVRISSQNQANTIMGILGHGGRFMPAASPYVASHVLDFLQQTEKDDWYKRAWVVQESMSAGRRLFLALKLGEGVHYPSYFRMEGPLAAPRGMNDTERHISEHAIVTIEHFRTLLRYAESLFIPAPETVSRTRYWAHESREPLFPKVRILHPEVIKSWQHLEFLRGNHYGHRQSVNASTAVTLLKHRLCKKAEDKIAIMANLCNYEIRLDTQEVFKVQKSLRFAMLSLALLNGDLSLLVPEAFDLKTHEEIVGTAAHTGGLFSPFDTAPGAIYSYEIFQESILPRMCVNLPRVQLGVPFHTNTWTVDKELDLSFVKNQYANAWEELQSLRIVVNPHPEEGSMDFKTREQSLIKYIKHPSRSELVMEEIAAYGHVRPDSDLWGNIDASDVSCTVGIDASRVDQDPILTQKLAGIVFGVLAGLNVLGDSEPAAKGAANSIWQSIRVDCAKKWQVDLPDAVDDRFFSNPEILLDKFATLELTVRNGLFYSQLWFVERVMQRGTLWVGTYNYTYHLYEVDDPEPYSANQHTQVPDIGGPSKDNSERTDVNTKHDAQNDSDSETASSASPASPASPMPTLSERFARRRSGKAQNILGRQRMAKIIVQEVGSARGSQEPGGNPFEMTNLNTASFLYYCLSSGEGLSSDAAEEHRRNTLVSVFDVEGPCLIATPFNADWECLPHSSLRGMSSCWVVERVETGLGISVSMYDEVCSNENRTRQKGKGKEREKIGSDLDLEAIREDPNAAEVSTSTYRVLNKVKGMWEIMDFPMNVAWFI